MELTERTHTGAFLLAEAPGKISRSKVTVTVPIATRLQPGFVLGKLTATGKYVPYDNVGNDGSEVAAAVLYSELNNDDAEATADKDGVVIDFCAEVAKGDLVWASGLNDADKTAAYADLATRGVKAR